MKESKCYLIVCCTLLLAGCSKDPLFKDKRTLTDSRDQHEYKSIEIGTQTWMAENLAYLPTVSPPSEGSNTLAYYYVYDYKSNNINEAKSSKYYKPYGVLYNWVAAESACPPGWHLPTDKDWSILEDFLGVNPGTKMKESSGWSEDANGDDRSGFSALPAGYRYPEFGFAYLGSNCYFWSSTVQGSNAAWSRELFSYDQRRVYRYYGARSHGFSVRCIRND
jgi:uncharacterized protein (TIGR02145 family)